MELPQLDKIDLNFQEKADPKVLQWFNGLYSRLGELITQTKALKIEFPKSYPVTGTVSIDKINLPPIEVTNFPDLGAGLRSISLGINVMQESVIKAITSQKLEVPKSTSINNEVT